MWFLNNAASAILSPRSARRFGVIALRSNPHHHQQSSIVGQSMASNSTRPVALFQTSSRAAAAGSIRSFSGKNDNIDSAVKHPSLQQIPQASHSLKERSNRVADSPSYHSEATEDLPGSKAFVECDRNALIDLFHKYAGECDNSGRSLDLEGLRKLLKAVGENLDPSTLERLFETADINGDGTIELTEFLHGSDMILGGAPAGIVLVIGGPGSGKGVLSKRLEEECGVVHLSSGDLLREEVRRDTVLGRQVRDIMARGELVSSAVIVTLMRRIMRNHPGKRVLLDGFPRSIQNAHDLVELCGVPELALHLECDDTLLMERILKRGEQANKEAAANAKSSQEDGGGASARSDDNIHTALRRLRTYHKYHNSTLEWLREQHVPVVNLDCSGDADSVWEQLCAIGRLMRPATRIDPSTSNTAAAILPNGLARKVGSSDDDDNSKVASG